MHSYFLLLSELEICNLPERALIGLSLNHVTFISESRVSLFSTHVMLTQFVTPTMDTFERRLSPSEALRNYYYYESLLV